MKVSPLLWITDPWNTLSHDHDTTLRFMQESINLGIPTYWSGSDFILNSPHPHLLRVVQVKHDAYHFPFNEEDLSPSIFHHLHYRVDPPIDTQYLSLLDSLLKRGAKETQIKSPPALLKSQSEKIPPNALHDLSPTLLCIPASHSNDLSADLIQEAQGLFQKKAWVVTKPLNLAQSLGVKKFATPQNEAAWSKLILTETENLKKGIVIQEYLPEVDAGEVRMWFAQGDLIACLKKYPKKGDFRVLIDEGSKVEAYFLSPSESFASERIGKVLKQQGVALAAIDLIGGKISDYNISSPGLLVQLEAVHGGTNFAKTILMKLMT